MPFLTNREVQSYRISVFESSTLNYTRAITLKLKPAEPAGDHSVTVEFPISAPVDFVTIGNTSSRVRLDRSKYEDAVHMLQTESPVYFSAFETAGTTPIRFAGLSTDPEFTGERVSDDERESDDDSKAA